MLTQQRDYDLSADYDARYLSWEARRRREDMMPELNRDGRPAAILWLEAALLCVGFLALLWLWMW